MTIAVCVPSKKNRFFCCGYARVCCATLGGVYAFTRTKIENAMNDALANTNPPPASLSPPALPAKGQEGPLPHDIRGLLDYPFTLGNLRWLLLAVAVLALLGLAYWFWKRRKRVLPQPPPEDPFTVLERQLRALLPPQPFEGKPRTQYFFDLNMILRQGLELSSPIRATDLTLQELKEPLRQKSQLSRDTVEDVLRFLERSEAIKFADAQTEIAEAERSHQQVLQWVAFLRPKRLDPGGSGHRI